MATERLSALASLLRPWEAVVAPVVVGDEHIPRTRPLLFVGNHTLFGIFDVPFLYAHLLREHGVALRSLGDHVHFKLPVWRNFLSAFGVVDGTPENTSALLRAREAVLVFPGGGREVAKRKHEKYRLVWKERLGFARLAIEHGATIVPFAAVGVEDAFDIVLDADEFLQGTPGRVLDRLGVRRDVVWPLAVGLGPTPLPRPERLYFQFLPPISTEPLRGKHTELEVCRALRDQTRAEVERGLLSLQALQARDPDRPLRRRLLKLARRWAPSFSSEANEHGAPRR